MLNYFKARFRSIPPEIISIIGKAMIVFLIWKLSYHLYLSPHKTIDFPLTNLTAKFTTHFLGLFEKSKSVTWQEGVIPFSNEFYKATIYINGKRMLGIADPCNALELFVLFIGYLICFPAPLKRFFIFSIVGVLVIFLLNIFRCSCMFWLNLHHNSLFHFAHHYAFKLIVYSVIFIGWYFYSKHLSIDEKV